MPKSNMKGKRLSIIGVILKALLWHVLATKNTKKSIRRRMALIASGKFKKHA